MTKTVPVQVGELETVELDLYQLSTELQKSQLESTQDEHTKTTSAFLTQKITQKAYTDSMIQALKDGTRSKLYLPTQNDTFHEFKIDCKDDQEITNLAKKLIPEDKQNDFQESLSLLLTEYCFNTQMTPEDKKTIEHYITNSIRPDPFNDLKPNLSFEEFMSVFFLYHQQAFFGVTGIWALYSSDNILIGGPGDINDSEKAAPIYVKRNSDGNLTLSTRYVMNATIMNDLGHPIEKVQPALCNLQLTCDGKMLPKVTSCTLKANQLDLSLPFDLPPEVKKIYERQQEAQKLLLELEKPIFTETEREPYSNLV